ncbi:MAG: UDP-diphosphatase [Flavobacteriales bacterium]|nr:UDP-diphosphatase [Flavobacteriales bacterium]
METLSYLLLGLVQGLTEFLPVSSSGHLTLGQAMLGLGEEDLTFTVLVHAATALSTVVVFRQDIGALIRDVLRAGDEGSKARTYTGLLLLSALPAAVVGLGFKDAIEALATPRFVGAMLCVTAAILYLSQRATSGTNSLGALPALGIGLAQACAILPGISRSGSTIGAALMLGVSRGEAARFSFLMALIPIGGATLLTLKDLMDAPAQAATGPWTGYIVGTVAAFVSGWVACTWMIRLVKRSNLAGFGAYCLAAGILALIFG